MRWVRCLALCLIASPAAASTLGGAPVERFYERILGDWVGTSVARLQGQEPATTYFHLEITRPNARTFREQFTFFRRNSKTGVLERSGSQTSEAVLEPDGQIRCTASATGTILIDFKPKKQRWQASGAGQCEGTDSFVAQVTGQISVDGMPLGLGKNGRIRKARATWTVKGPSLLGRTEVDSRFRALFLSKSFQLVSELRAERGRDIRAYVARLSGAARIAPTIRRSASASVSSRFGKAKRMRPRPSFHSAG
jgi:hypothetical protein